MKVYIVTYIYRCNTSSADFDDFYAALRFFYSVRSVHLLRRKGNEYVTIM